MKIDTAQQNYAAELDSAHRKPDAKPTVESRQPLQAGSATFNVSLSTQAQQAAAQDKVEEEASRTRVDAIREQLASGTYSISGKDVATKMLRLLKG
jgi:flagellar biosynthesis anti-sigma factor FlgM